MVNERTIKAITEMSKDTRKILRTFKPHGKGNLMFDFNQYVRELKQLFKRKQRELLIQNNVWLVDYTAQSTTVLKLHKNRYLLTIDGRYFIKGYVIALNTITRQLICIETARKQMISKDVETLRKYLPKDSILITDKHHNHATNGTKKTTQLIEDYFGGMKKPIYAEIRHLQVVVYSIRGNEHIATKISYEQLNDIYERRFEQMKIITVRKAHPKVERKHLK